MILSGDRFKAKNVKPFFMSVSVTGGSYPYLRLLQPGRGGGVHSLVNARPVITSSFCRGS